MYVNYSDDGCGRGSTRSYWREMRARSALLVSQVHGKPLALYQTIWKLWHTSATRGHQECQFAEDGLKDFQFSYELSELWFFNFWGSSVGNSKDSVRFPKSCSCGSSDHREWSLNQEMFRLWQRGAWQR